MIFFAQQPFHRAISRTTDRSAVYGSVRAVVWEGGGAILPYPNHKCLRDICRRPAQGSTWKATLLVRMPLLRVVTCTGPVVAPGGTVA